MHVFEESKIAADDDQFCTLKRAGDTLAANRVVNGGGSMVWGTIWRIVVAGAALGAACGALYILVLAGAAMVRHPNAGAIPAVLIFTYLNSILGGLSGTFLGIVNGVLVASVSLPLSTFARGRETQGRIALFGTVAIMATTVNLLAVRAVLHWWLGGGTATFVEFPLIFGWISAVLVDLWVTRWVYLVRGMELG